MTPTRCPMRLGSCPSVDSITLWASLARPAAGAVAGAIDALIPVAAVRRREFPGVGVECAAAVAMPATSILVRLLLAVLPAPSLGRGVLDLKECPTGGDGRRPRNQPAQRLAPGHGLTEEPTHRIELDRVHLRFLLLPLSGGLP